MADWSTPTLVTAHATYLQALKDRDADALTMLVNTPSNQPVGAIRYLRASDKFQEWDGAAWNDKILSLAGGGTGATTAATSRTALGLGTMATQDSSAVAISGGSLAGTGSGLTSLNAANIATGTVATARLGSGSASSATFLRGDSAWAVLVLDIPYGADQSSPFTAAVNTFYNLLGSSTVTLPSVVGNGGKIIGFIKKGTGTWSIAPNGAETLLGQNPYSFNWGQFACITLKADANGGKWDLI